MQLKIGNKNFLRVHHSAHLLVTRSRSLSPRHDTDDIPVRSPESRLGKERISRADSSATSPGLRSDQGGPGETGLGSHRNCNFRMHRVVIPGNR